MLVLSPCSSVVRALDSGTVPVVAARIRDALEALAICSRKVWLAVVSGRGRTAYIGQTKSASGEDRAQALDPNSAEQLEFPDRKVDVSTRATSCA